MSLEINLTITLDSDFHVGTGFGIAHHVDDRLLKDENGLPYLPGSTVKALIRDGFERLCELDALQGVEICDGEYLKPSSNSTAPSYLCGIRPLPGHEGNLKWRCPLCRVFGTAITLGSFAFSEASLPEATLRQKLRQGAGKSSLQSFGGDRALEGATAVPTQFASYNRIDRETGRAEDDKLFSFELGTAGTEFRATITELIVPADEFTRRQNWLVIAAGCAFVEELGKRRRRGVGRCRFTLERNSLNQALKLGETDILEKMSELLQPAPVPTAVSAQVNKSSSRYKGRYTVLAFTTEPLLISNRAETASNNLHSLDYINGTSLRGALATAFLHRKGGRTLAELKNHDETGAQTFYELFGYENLRVSNLLPALVDHERGSLSTSIPAPRSVRTCKLYPGPRDPRKLEEPHGLTDYLSQAKPGKICPRCNAPLENYSGFLVPNIDKDKGWSQPHECKVLSQVIMHNAVDDHTGRAGNRQLFSYQPLQSGQWFAGTIEELEEASGLLAKLLEALEVDPTGGRPLTLRLGRAGARGQGQVQLYFLEAGQSLLVETSLEERFPDPASQTGEIYLNLMLMSDCILQDDRLCYQTTIPGTLLAGWLGLDSGGLTDENAYTATRIIGGWNRAHGLPRENELAIVAGSVFRYRLQPGLPTYSELLVNLKRLEQRGLGQRCEEGFGRVVFNHPIHTSLRQLRTRK